MAIASATATATSFRSTDDQGRKEGHLRVIAGDRVRVVRLLSVRLACAVHRGSVLPKGNETAALHLRAFATYAAGFLVRPFGALLFGRIGDMIGRKYTFLVTILVMGSSTFMVGLLPTLRSRSVWPLRILMVTLRLLQGLALGGEYGGAATYVAEHAPHSRRGYDTSWIQTTATLGFFMALVIIGGARVLMEAKAFADWGWRIPFLVLGDPACVLGVHPAEACRSRRCSRR